MADIKDRNRKPKVVKVAERFMLPPVVTGSTWANVFGAIWNAAKTKRGAATASDKTTVPRLTNREVVAFIEAWRAVAPMAPNAASSWPGGGDGYQFEAIAWGWDPSTDMFDVSDSQADKLYPIDPSHDMWVAAERVSRAMDAETKGVPPRLELDQGAFSDLLVQGDVRQKLVEDGGLVAFKSPMRDFIENLKRAPDDVKKIVDKIKVDPEKGLVRKPDFGKLLLIGLAGVAAFVLARKLGRGRRPTRATRSPARRARRSPRRLSAGI